MRYLAALIFILLSSNTYAQREVSRFSKNAPPQGPVMFKLSPLAAIDDVSFPTIQGGLELRLAPELTWYNEFGIQYRKNYYEKADVDTSFFKAGGYKLKSEFRYYFQNDNKWPFNGYYLAVNAFFTKDHHNNQIDYYLDGNTSDERHDAFGVLKTVFGMNIVAGYQESISGRFLFEIYAGAGFRSRTIKTTHKEFDPDKDTFIGSIDFNIDMNRQLTDAENRPKLQPNITLGIRIGFIL